MRREEIRKAGYPVDVEKALIFLNGIKEPPDGDEEARLCALAADCGDNAFYQLALEERLIEFRLRKGDREGANDAADAALDIMDGLGRELAGRPLYERARANVLQAAGMLSFEDGETEEALELLAAARDSALAAGEDPSGIEAMMKEAQGNG